MSDTRVGAVNPGYPVLGRLLRGEFGPNRNGRGAPVQIRGSPMITNLLNGSCRSLGNSSNQPSYGLPQNVIGVIPAQHQLWAARRSHPETSRDNRSPRRELESRLPTQHNSTGHQNPTAASRVPDLRKYRTRAVILDCESWDNCPPEKFIKNQIKELIADLSEPEEATPTTGDSEDTCSQCLTNKATRFVVPCGHSGGCVQCCLQTVKVPLFKMVTTETGVKKIRLPIRCPICRCLVGKYLRIFR